MSTGCHYILPSASWYLTTAEDHLCQGSVWDSLLVTLERVYDICRLCLRVFPFIIGTLLPLEANGKSQVQLIKNFSCEFMTKKK